MRSSRTPTKQPRTALAQAAQRSEQAWAKRAVSRQSADYLRLLAPLRRRNRCPCRRPSARLRRPLRMPHRQLSDARRSFPRCVRARRSTAVALQLGAARDVHAHSDLWLICLEVTSGTGIVSSGTCTTGALPVPVAALPVLNWPGDPPVRRRPIGIRFSVPDVATAWDRSPNSGPTRLGHALVLPFTRAGPPLNGGGDVQFQ